LIEFKYESTLSVLISLNTSVTAHLYSEVWGTQLAFENYFDRSVSLALIVLEGAQRGAAIGVRKFDHGVIVLLLI
jgi:hypothetical protein